MRSTRALVHALARSPSCCRRAGATTQTSRGVADAVATCEARQASDGTPEATAGLVRATSIRFSGATTMTQAQAQAVLDVVRGEPWCR